MTLTPYTRTYGPLRKGVLRSPGMLLLLSLVAMALLAASLRPWSGSPTPPAEVAPGGRGAAEKTPLAAAQPATALVVYCAASNKGVLEEIRQEYERTHPVTLQIQYGASQTLLASLEVTGAGDLYLPADESYLALARARNLLGYEAPLATMQAVLITPQGNPRRITRLADLLGGEVRLAQADPEAAAIGKLTRAALSPAGLWAPLAGRTTVFKTTVTEVATAVQIGAVDAGVVYDVLLADFPALSAVPLPELAPVRANVSVGVLRASRQPVAARAFADYLAAPEGGQKFYRQRGFGPPALSRPRATAP